MEHPVIDEGKMSTEQKKFYDDYLVAAYTALKLHASHDNKLIKKIKFCNGHLLWQEVLFLFSIGEDNEPLNKVAIVCSPEFVFMPDESFIEKCSVEDMHRLQQRFINQPFEVI